MPLCVQSGGRGVPDPAVHRRPEEPAEHGRELPQGLAGQPHVPGEGDLLQEEQHLHRPRQVHDPPHTIPIHHQASGLPVTHMSSLSRLAPLVIEQCWHATHYFTLHFFCQCRKIRIL